MVSEGNGVCRGEWMVASPWTTCGGPLFESGQDVVPVPICGGDRGIQVVEGVVDLMDLYHPLGEGRRQAAGYACGGREGACAHGGVRRVPVMVVTRRTVMQVSSSRCPYRSMTGSRYGAIRHACGTGWRSHAPAHRPGADPPAAPRIPRVGRPEVSLSAVRTRSQRVSAHDGQVNP